MNKIYNTWVQNMVCPKCGSNNVVIDILDVDELENKYVELGNIFCLACEHSNDFTAYYELTYIELEETENEND